MSKLTDEQRLQIEEKRRKAQALRASKLKKTEGQQAHVDINLHTHEPGAKSHESNAPIQSHVNRPNNNAAGISTCSGNVHSGNANQSIDNAGRSKNTALSKGPVEQQRPTGLTNFSSGKTVANQNALAVSNTNNSSLSGSGQFCGSGKQQQNSSGTRNNSLTSAQKRQGLYTTSQALHMILNSPSKLAARKKKARVTGKCVLKSRCRFEVQINYHAVTVAIFKGINSKMYDSKTRQWSFDLLDYEALMRQILAVDEVFIDPLPKFVVQCFKNRITGKDEPTKEIPEADLSQVDSKLVSSLMSFQREGVNFGIWKNGRILIADDMGLGKTIQAICLACYYHKEWPVLVVVPSSVRFSWRVQFLTWVPSLDPQSINVVVSGKDNLTSGKVNIVSYDLMARRSEILLGREFKVVIMDESHSLKNFKTARTKAAGPLLKKAQRVILLSGTPALSRPSELFPQIASVNPRLFPSFREFGIRYCDGKEMPWGWDFSGSSNMEELQVLLEENVMIRRLKKDVLSELPSKRREMVILDPASVRIDKSMSTSHKLVDKLKGMDRRGALLEYFHATSNAKVKAVTEFVLELLENDHKFLLFAHHQDMLDAIEQAVGYKKFRYIRIDGRTAAEERQNLCDKFQSNADVKIAILSITAANAGINLTAASLVVFAELFWNPGILVQAEDRVHRLGQENSVLIRYLVGTGTADDYIWPLVQKKLDILGKAGLSKDDFSTADTTSRKDPKQEDIMSYFEESFFEEDSNTDDLKQENELEVKESKSSIKAAPSTSFGTPSRKTPRKKLVPSPGQTTLLKFFSPTKSEENSPQKNTKLATKRSLFSGDLSTDEIAAKELTDVMKMADDDLFGDFTEEFEPCAPKKAKLS